MLSIKKTLKDLVPAKFIESPFEGSKSSSNQVRGCWAEQKVIDYFQKQQFKLIHQRKKIMGIEVDLIFTDQKGSALMVEVKNIKTPDHIPMSLSRKQKKRLQNALTVLCERYSEVNFQMAYVSRNAEITIIDENIF